MMLTRAALLAAVPLVVAGGCARTGPEPVVRQPAPPAPRLTPQRSGTTSRLQAISAVDARVAWVSGLGGSYAVTTDGGATWRAGVIPGAEQAELRDVHAVSDRAAYLLASGPGAASAIHRTVDGGASWTVVARNRDPDGFWDCFSFRDATHAVLMADPVKGRFPLLRTTDGERWTEVTGPVPPALPGEAAFAASGTCVATRGAGLGWIVTGGVDPARLLVTRDGGASWEARPTPIPGGEGAGGFSVAFRDAVHGIAAGGSLARATERSATVARSSDGGETWQLAASPGFPGAIYGLAHAAGRAGSASAVAVVATGPGGSAWSPDEGDSWLALPGAAGYWSVGFGDERTGWLVGTDGRILRIDLPGIAGPPGAR